MKKIYEIVRKAVRKALLEAQNDFSNLYAVNNGDNITDYVFTYLRYSQMGKSDANFSIIASQLHDGLMNTLGLDHEETEDRETFARILGYIRILQKHLDITSITICNYADWEINASGAEEIYIEAWDFHEKGHIDDIYDKAIVFKDRDGIDYISTDYREGSCNGSSGYYTTHAKMTEEMKQKIYRMGLVPALLEFGSYHENFLYSCGVLPEMVSILKKQDEDESVHFKCEF